MIDRRRRDQFAELLRHFAAGRLTNDDYEDRVGLVMDEADDDPALDVVYEQAWLLYDDLRTQLGRAGRREVARWVLFLYSDQEYEWPRRLPHDRWYLLLNIATLGAWVFLGGNHRQRRLGAYGDWEVWPFIRRADFEAELKRPRLFGGGSA
jgi:hypothetical protein